MSAIEKNLELIPPKNKEVTQAQPVSDSGDGEPKATEERYTKAIDQAEPAKKKFSQLNEAADVWGKLFIGIATLLISLLIGYNQIHLAKELNDKQQQQANNIEDLRKGLAENQLNVQKQEFAAGLIGVLLKGSEKEKKLALMTLERVDKELALAFSEVLAQNDPDVGVRLKAIEVLSKAGGGSTRQILSTIQKEGKTNREREEARRAEDSMVSKFREILTRARAYYNAKSWELAAYYFNEASGYLDEAHIDRSKLQAAKSHYEHKGYYEAATAFNSLLSDFKSQ